MATSTKQAARRKPAQPTQHIGRDGNQIHHVRHAKITIGDTGRGVLGKIAAVATIVGTIIAIFAVSEQDTKPGRTPEPTFPASSRVVPAPVYTRIVNSGADGVYTYPQPRHGSHFPDGYMDGTVVGVVCQDRHGDAVRDRDPVPGQPSTWAVWDQLNTGRWIPDMWTSLPKNPGETPPNELPTC
jgi:hypothetical protein